MSQIILPSSMSQSQKPTYSKPSMCISTEAPVQAMPPPLLSSCYDLLLKRGKLPCKMAPFLCNIGFTAKVRIYLDSVPSPAIQ